MFKANANSHDSENLGASMLITVMATAAGGGRACQGLGSLSLTRPWGQSITRLHTHTDGEPPTSHRRTNPPYDS